MTWSISSRTSSTPIWRANFLVDITKSLKDDPSLKAPDFDETHFTTFANYFKNADGDLFGVPMEAFIKIYLYRTDLFNDPEVQEAFKEKTGHDLVPAKTHEEYTEIAEFFTQWGKDKGIDLWGTTAQAPPATRLPGTSSSSRSPRRSASTTGASTPRRTTPPPSRTAAR